MLKKYPYVIEGEKGLLTYPINAECLIKTENGTSLKNFTIRLSS